MTDWLTLGLPRMALASSGLGLPLPPKDGGGDEALSPILPSAWVGNNWPRVAPRRARTQEYRVRVVLKGMLRCSAVGAVGAHVRVRSFSFGMASAYSDCS